MTLDPRSHALLELVASAGAPPLAEQTVQSAREGFAGMIDLIGPGPELADVRDAVIDGPAGSMTVRVYTPGEDVVATVVYIRGGGWTLGSLAGSDAFCRALARDSNSIVAAIDYRNAPEHAFPAAVDDSLTGLRWAADTFGGPLVICGDSAGGNLAAVCAARTTEEGGPELALQVLMYPVADHDFNRRSYSEHGDSGLLVGTAEMRWFWDHYVPDASQRDHRHASPLRAESFEGLPPAYVVLAEYDPLRDEGQELANRLSSAGVDVTVRFYEDQLHGFATMVNYLAVADAVVAEIGETIKRLA